MTGVIGRHVGYNILAAGTAGNSARLTIKDDYGREYTVNVKVALTRPNTARLGRFLAKHLLGVNAYDKDGRRLGKVTARDTSASNATPTTDDEIGRINKTLGEQVLGVKVGLRLFIGLCALSTLFDNKRA
jgi:hypothetical protein